MFRRIASFVARHAKLVALAWFLLAGVLMATAPKFEDVATQDTSAFLGNDAPSIQGAIRIYELWPDDEFSQSAAIVLPAAVGLTGADSGSSRRSSVAESEAAPDNVRLTQTPYSRPELGEVLTSADGRG